MDAPQKDESLPSWRQPVKLDAGTTPSTLATKVGIGAVCLIIAWGAFKFSHTPAVAKAGKTAGGNRAEMPPVSVVSGVVASKDVPVFLDGLGTVQAFNSVLVRARVDGQLRKIAFEEGQDVKRGDLLALIDPDPFRAQLEQAKAKQGQDEALLTNAREDLKRYAGLLANEGVTRQVYDTQQSQVNQLEAAVKADEAAVRSAQVQLDYTTIVSPIDGRVGIRLVDQGNMVRSADANGLVTIAQLRPVSVVFTLPEQTLSQIQQQLAKGDTLSVFAVGRDNASVLGAGQLAVIDNQIDTTTATIKLKATFPNADLRLWPGQFVTARLLLLTHKNQPVVPAQAIQRGPENSVFVFVIKENQTVEVRRVKVGQIEQGEALIEEGLSAGEQIVIDGQYKLQKDSRVKTSDASAPGGPKAGQVKAEPAVTSRKPAL